MKMDAPVARKELYEQFVHGEKLTDSYNWLRDKNWPKVTEHEVLEYLKQENTYTNSFFEPHTKMLDLLYNELVGRIQLADKSAPIKRGKYYYYHITNEDSNYPIHMRMNEDGREEVTLDENIEAKEYNYYQISNISISPRGNLMTYLLDTIGDEHYSIYIKDLPNKKMLSDRINNALGAVVWSEDSEGFYYTKVDEKWRPNELYYHKLGAKQEDDILVYKEIDNTFRISLSKSTDYKYVIIDISSTNSTEILFIDADDNSHKLNTFIQRREDHICSVDHIHGYFYITTNDRGKNFRLVRTSSKSTNHIYEELIPHSNTVYLTNFGLYDRHIVISTKELGLTKITIFDYSLQNKKVLDFPDPTYTAYLISSSHDDTGVMIRYSAMTSLTTVFKYDFSTNQLNTIRVVLIPSGFNKEEYCSERVLVPSRETGMHIPISIAYKKNIFKKDGTNPALVYGYGSYGIAIPPRFSSNVLSLLNRGFVYVIAHIRGGDDLGFEWYESSKFLNKKRTFNDFLDSIHYLIDSKYTSKGNIAILGASAGGMLVGNVINQEPELFKAAIADAPFVDVLNTMLDDTLPLTPGEFKEWGNPRDKIYFDYIKSYSPYDNVKGQAYPNLYVLAGLNDPRVAYWEPAKWVAKLREYKTDTNTLLLETDRETGHGGKSGRFDRFKEIAKKYAFLFIVFGIQIET